MVILGINSAYHEQAAALIVDGRLLAAAEEERFNGVKHGKYPRVDNADDLPWRAIQYCLRRASIKPSEVTLIGYSFDPWIRRQSRTRETDTKGWQIPGTFGTKEGEIAFYRSNLRARDALTTFMPRAAFRFLQHHLCHAASAFLVSPFQRSAILVADGIGELASTWAGVGDGHTIESLFEIRCPHSLGFLWEQMSEFLGFDRYEGPGKLMALGTSAGPVSLESGIDYREHMSRLLHQDIDGGFTINTNLLQYGRIGFKGLESLFGDRAFARKPSEKKTIAAALQLATEDVLCRLAIRLHHILNGDKRGVNDALCLAGGVALNCAANFVLTDRTPFKHIWIQPAAHDAGTALGAALVLWHMELGQRERIVFEDVYLGPDFSSDSCEAALLRAGLPYTRPSGLASRVASLVAAGHVVAWFNGRMEFGPRALGSRSIVADPQILRIRSRINEIIKEREIFRPFAPSVLACSAAEYFALTDRIEEKTNPADFMLISVPVKPDQALGIPAVVHRNDSTGHVTSRIQLVREEKNPAYTELLEQYRETAGIPLILNTSFNVHGPIVCSPYQACGTFLHSGLDAMALGPFLVTRA
jgi:carbamoyltransferase